MVMTKADIIAEYNQSKDHRKQITILADQNLVSEQEIADILAAGGCKVPSYKYRKTPGSTKDRAPRKKAPAVTETDTVTIKRSSATKMIVEKAALDTIRSFLTDPEITWEEFCWFISGVVDLTVNVEKRCGE